MSSHNQAPGHPGEVRGRGSMRPHRIQAILFHRCHHQSITLFVISSANRGRLRPANVRPKGSLQAVPRRSASRSGGIPAAALAHRCVGMHVRPWDSHSSRARRREARVASSFGMPADGIAHTPGLEPSGRVGNPHWVAGMEDEDPRNAAPRQDAKCRPASRLREGALFVPLAAMTFGILIPSPRLNSPCFWAAAGRRRDSARLGAAQLAARLGFEPRQTDPESAVLPLHHRANGGSGAYLIPEPGQGGKRVGGESSRYANRKS